MTLVESTFCGLRKYVSSWLKVRFACVKSTFRFCHGAKVNIFKMGLLLKVSYGHLT